MNKKILLIILVLSITLFSKVSAQKISDDNSAIESKIDALLQQMTLEEKIGQMTLYTSDWDVTGPTIRSGYRKDIEAGKVGAIFNAYSVDYVRDLQSIAVEKTRMKIPLMFGYDVIHGHRTIFPMPLAQAATWNMEAIEHSERIAAIEATAEGLNWTFTPMVDIARDPRWGRIMEGSGEDTYLTSRIAVARVKGFQGDNLAADNTMVACAKHYAAYGAAIAGRDYNTVDMSDRVLRETYLPPFKACVEAGVGTFMTSFNEVDGIPATGNEYLLREILKKEWDFDGFVVTDYTSIAEMVPHGIVANNKEAGELAVNAGVDMDMQSGIFIDYLAQSVKEGKVDVSDIDDAVRRILRIKMLLGLFDDPYKYCDKQRQDTLIYHPEHLAFAREFTAESMVLLKNQNQLLPLSKQTGTIAVIGPLADSKKDMIGAWSAAGDFNKSVTVLEGIKEKLPKQRVIYAQGCEVDGDDRSGFDEAVTLASRSDAVVLVIGETKEMSGEAASRSEITLPGVQQELAEALIATGKPVVVVLINGRPLDLSWLDTHVPAILEAWFPGTQAGHAVADVLFGDYNPSGKLTVTFPRNLGQVPIFYNNKNTGRPMSSDKYTSKYLDVANTPLYPFGYGLSYTTFQYDNLKISSPVLKANQKIEVSVQVTNTGKMAGQEVVQLYLRDLVGSVTRPVKELKDFRKIYLEPGAQSVVTFEITPATLEFLTRDMQWAAEPGEFDVFVGTDSGTTQSVRFSYSP
ncbi:MAG: beta-glucosidase BglX [Clostridia bacterium]|nr:beta-glucosidase BglX [Clostridia bacterium]